jgi:hypothetical protein
VSADRPVVTSDEEETETWSSWERICTISDEVFRRLQADEAARSLSLPAAA